jgi:hypothetical protein
MIDFQSVFCVGRPNSPKGCGRLAGDNIPGHQPNDLCALEGRWRELISFASVPSMQNTPKLQNEPNFQHKLLSIKKKRR